MNNKIETRKMSKSDISDAISLWYNQFEHFNLNSAIYSHLKNITDDIAEYINRAILQGNAFAASQEGNLVGFITYDIFDFHDAKSAICHFIGNAAATDNRKQIFSALYKDLCKHSVERGALTHYIAFNGDDIEAKDVFFNLGFGSYGLDGFTCFDNARFCISDYDIMLADKNDAGDLYEIVKESIEYFSSSPICLLNEPQSIDNLVNLTESSRIFIAKDNGKIVGFMNLSKVGNNNIYRMDSKGCAAIDGIGAFIKEEYRGKNIGSHFLKKISEYCNNNMVSYVRVSWESANPYANRFWRKFFEPTVLALKRTIHPDVIK